MAENSQTGRLSTHVLAPIARLALITDGKNQYSVVSFLDAIKSRVTGPAAGYHQLAQFMLDGTADQRMSSQQGDGFLDQPKRFSSRCGIALDREVGQPFEIGKCPCRIDQLRQDSAFGFADFLPAMRALRWAWTASAS